MIVFNETTSKELLLVDRTFTKIRAALINSSLNHYDYGLTLPTNSDSSLSGVVLVSKSDMSLEFILTPGSSGTGSLKSAGIIKLEAQPLKCLVSSRKCVICHTTNNQLEIVDFDTMQKYIHF